MGSVKRRGGRHLRPTAWRRSRCALSRILPTLCLLVACSEVVAARSSAASGCSPADRPLSFGELVSRIEISGTRYVFVGERHSIGPVKRFAVELANRLEERGHEVGLYVEGFRTGCSPTDEGCSSLARWFNPSAFGSLLRESRVPVRPLDPSERDLRGERMARTIAAGPESVRIALVGLSHVRHAGNPHAEVRVFGGAIAFANPGDVVEAFPREQTLTIGLDARSPASEVGSVDRLTVDGCEFDVVFTTADSEDYWANSSRDSARLLARGEGAPSDDPLPTSAPEATASGAEGGAGLRH